MRALIVDLPLCLQQLRRMRSEVECSSRSCHGSGSTPRSQANATRSRESSRSSLRATIACCSLYGSHDGFSGVPVGFQGSDYHGPKLDPFRAEMQVKGWRTVEFPGDLAYKFQIVAYLPYGGRHRHEVVGLFGATQDGFCSPLQSLDTI